MPEQRRILVLYAHPASYCSTVNQTLFNAVRGLTGMTARDAKYPTFDIDVLHEQRLLKKHDVIIFLCPFYWHSTPALLEEFAFVLSYFSVQQNIILTSMVPIQSLVITLSMLLTPLLFILYEKLILSYYEKKGAAQTKPNDTVGASSKIIVAGIGRFGQVVSRALSANGYLPVVLDLLPRHIDAMRLVNIPAYYGDATHPDLLVSAGIEDAEVLAEVLVVAIDDQDKALELVHFVEQVQQTHHVYQGQEGYGYREESHKRASTLMTDAITVF